MSEEKNKAVQYTDEQKQAIETIDSNVAVSAGAGSGKTKVLVARFMYILEQSLAQKKPLGRRISWRLPLRVRRQAR